MAELRYVDWDGLVYYDSKSKQYIADKLGDCVKMGGVTAFDALPSPSFQNVNYIYKVTNQFTSNDYFEKPGYVYRAGTWVQVTDLGGVYLYTIFNEEDTSPLNPIDPGTVDLTNYYTKDEVDGIVGELPTKEDVNQAIVDAFEDVEIDTTGLVTKEEFDVVQQQSARNEVKLLMVDSELVDIKAQLENIQDVDLTGYATEDYVAEKISEIEIPDVTNFATKDELPSVEGLATEEFVVEKISGIDIPSTEGLATETFVHEMIAKAELEDKEADLEAYYTKDQVNALIPDVSNFASKDELPNIDGLASEEFVEDAIKNIQFPTTDLSGYYTKEEVDTAINSLYIPSIDGLATTAYVDSKIGEVKVPTNVSDLTNDAGYITAFDVPDTSNFITMKDVEDKGYLTEHQSLDEYAKKSDIENKADKSDLNGLATETFVVDKIAEAQLAGKDVDLSNYYTKGEVNDLIPDVSKFITEDDIPSLDGYATKEWVQNQNYLTEHIDITGKADVSELNSLGDRVTELSNVVDGKAESAHTHSLSEIVDYQPPELSNFATKDDINGLATEQYVSDRISEIVIPDVSEFLTEIPEEYVTSAELEAEGFLKEHQDLSDYAKKSDIPDVDDFITMSDVEGKGFLTEVPSEYITEDELSAKGYITDVSGKADVEHTHSYNELTDKPTIPSVDGLATEQYVDDAISNIDIPTVDTSKFVTSDALGEALGAKANDVLFTDDYRVGTPIGLFAQDDPVQGLTITEIITRILGLTLHIPEDTPDLPENVPEETPEDIKEIISNEAHAYTLDGTGTGNFIEAETSTFYKQMTPEESYEKSTENFFYQIVDPDTNELLESGYQIKTVEDEEEWLTIAIPSTVTNFHVEQFNQLASGDDKWVRVTGFTLVPNDDQPIDGYTVYSADNFDGGITIRIVID